MTNKAESTWIYKRLRIRFDLTSTIQTTSRISNGSKPGKNNIYPSYTDQLSQNFLSKLRMIKVWNNIYISNLDVNYDTVSHKNYRYLMLGQLIYTKIQLKIPNLFVFRDWYILIFKFILVLFYYFGIIFLEGLLKYVNNSWNPQEYNSK